MVLPDLTPRTSDEMRSYFAQHHSPLACTTTVVMGSIAVHCWDADALQPQDDFDVWFGKQAEHLLGGMAISADNPIRIRVPIVSAEGVLQEGFVGVRDLNELLAKYTVLDATPYLRTLENERNAFVLEYARSDTQLKGWIVR